MKNALVAVVVLVVLLIGIGLLYMYSGSYNVAASEDLGGLTRWVFRTTTIESIEAHAEPMEIQASPSMLREGAHHFREMCVMCHGAPGVEAKWVGKGLTPEPPDLSEAATAYSTGELYWIVEHGIKHTGMPALAPTHSDKEIRAIVAFVDRLPDMSEQEYQKMTTDTTGLTADTTGSGEHAGHTH